MTYMFMARIAALKCVEVADTLLPNTINVIQLPARLAMLNASVLHSNKATAHAEAQVVGDDMQRSQLLPAGSRCHTWIASGRLPGYQCLSVHVGTTYNVQPQCARLEEKCLLCCNTYAD